MAGSLPFPQESCNYFCNSIIAEKPLFIFKEHIMQQHVKLCLLLGLFLALFTVAMADIKVVNNYEVAQNQSVQAGLRHGTRTGDELIIGTGDNTMYPLPIHVNRKYSYSQSIYLASEIGREGKQIDSIAYYWNGGANAPNSRNWEIWMGHTDRVAFANKSDWVAQEDLMLVFCGQTPALITTAGWIDIALDNSFAYNHNKNLVIAVRQTSTRMDPDTGKFHCTLTGGVNRSLLYFDENTNPDPGTVPATWQPAAYPNIKMSFSDLPDHPVSTITPNSWDAGEIVIGTQASQEFTIRNEGIGTLEINDVSISGDYFAFAAPFSAVSLQTGESVRFTVNFTPLSLGYFQGEIAIDTSLGAQYITLEGQNTDTTIRTLPYTQNFDTVDVGDVSFGWTVLNPDNPETTWHTDSYFEYCNSYPHNMKIGRSPAPSGLPLDDWLITPPVVLDAGVEYRISYYFRARGGIEAFEETLRLKVGEYPTAEAMTTILAENVSFNNIVYQKVIAYFTPSTAGNYYFAWHANSPVAQYGIHLDDITIDLSPATPVIKLINDHISFGGFPGDTASAYEELVIFNNGIGTLTIEEGDISFGGNSAELFGIDSSVLPLNIAAETSASLPVRFLSSDAGYKTATIEIVNSITSDVHEATLSALVAGEDDIYESFEDEVFPPAGWANQGSWERRDFQHKEGLYSAYCYGNTSTHNILITPMLAINDGDMLSFWSRSNSIESKLHLFYSVDGDAWTQFGSHIRHTKKDTWQNSTIDLSALAGGNYYFGFGTGLDNATFYIDVVAAPEPATVLPGRPSLVSPANESTKQSNTPLLRWTVPTDGGYPRGYRVYLDENPIPTTFVGESDTNSLMPAIALDLETLYYWKVAAYNKGGEGEASEVFSFTVRDDGVIRSFPFFESFEDGNIDESWTISQWGQIVGSTHTDKYWTAIYTGKYYYPEPRTGDWFIALERDGESTLVRPIILEGGQSYNLEFWAEVNADSGANVKAVLGTDDQLSGELIEIIPSSVVSGYGYQRFYGEFIAPDTGMYYLGIYGYIGSIPWNLMYLGLDDISITIPTNQISGSFSTTNWDLDDVVITATDIDADDISYDANTGEYSITVPRGYTGRVTPTKDGYIIDPASRDYTGVNTDIDNENYVIKKDVAPPVAITYPNYEQRFKWLEPTSITIKWRAGEQEAVPYSLQSAGRAVKEINHGNSRQGETFQPEYYEIKFGDGEWEAVGLITEYETEPLNTGEYTFAVRGVLNTPQAKSYTKVNLQSSNSVTQESRGTGYEVRVVFSVTIYAALPGTTSQIGEHTSITIEGDGFLGALDIDKDEGDLTPIPNAGFIAANHKVWQLTGSGIVTLKITTSADWFAYVVGGEWVALQGPLNDYEITIDLGAKDSSFEFADGSGSNPSLPVELSSFSVALNTANSSVVSWVTESETGVSGFYIYRGRESQLKDAALISGLIEATNSSQTQKYSFTDETIYEQGNYYYWLAISDFDGRDTYHGPIAFAYGFEDEGEIPQIPYQTKLIGAYPNPFNPETNIGFELAEQNEVVISIYNMRGQLVRSFAPKTYEAGVWSLPWDGKDNGGKGVSSGIYHIRMVSGNKRFISKALLMK